MLYLLLVKVGSHGGFKSARILATDLIKLEVDLAMASGAN